MKKNQILILQVYKNKIKNHLIKSQKIKILLFFLLIKYTVIFHCFYLIII